MAKKKVQPQNQMLGEDRDVAIDTVKPNTWNPNKMTAAMRDSLKQDLQVAWVKSQRLLVWGKDEKGVERNIIIDGEHRWRIAKELGCYPVVPCTFVDGITEMEATEMTIRIDHKRGDFDQIEISELLKEIREVNLSEPIDDFAVRMGYEPPEMARMLEIDVPKLDDGMRPAPINRVPKVTLEFSTADRRDEFKTMMAAACKSKGDKPAGDVLLTKLRRA